MTLDHSGKPGLHPRNRHKAGYDFAQLCDVLPELSEFLVTTPAGQTSIEFANPQAVKALNRALLLADYGVRNWDIPADSLCPPVPGRVDYIHGLADLLAREHRGRIPRGGEVRVLDIGTGANLIYPLLGHAEYGWSFVASDTNADALRNAQGILDANPAFAQAIELCRQRHPRHIFQGIVHPEERFDLSMCNPPFHASAEEARAGSERKWRQLGREEQVKAGRRGPELNFGGSAGELWCEGGERGFITRMIRESRDYHDNCRWFTTLVSKSASMPVLEQVLREVDAQDVLVLPMAQGQKQSRILAWTFL